MPVGILEAIILGLVQGLTEFLPISSSAHLRIVGEFLGTGADPGAAFTAITQLGTEIGRHHLLLARHQTHRLQVGPLAGRPGARAPTRMPAWAGSSSSAASRSSCSACIFQTAIETTLRSLWIIATTLIVFGILLGVADVVGAKKRKLRELTWPHAIIYGLAQALALIPGVSRSGGTMTGGLFLGYDRRAVARYSFLLAIPAVFGSGLYQLYKTIKEPCLNVASGCAPEVFSGVENGDRDRHRVHRRLRRDRVLHALHHPALVPAVRDLPHPARRRPDRAAVHRSAAAQLG